MAERSSLRIGDIAVYREGNAFLMNQVVYVDGLSYGRSNQISVCTLVPWTVPLGWVFGVSPEDLEVICHFDPVEGKDKRGSYFNPEWLKSISQELTQAKSDFQKMIS